MKTFNNNCAQGDVFFKRVDSIPEDAVEKMPENGKYVVAHSESGHHHSVAESGVKMFMAKVDGQPKLFLVTTQESVITHEKTVNKHEDIMLPVGNFEVIRQREYANGYTRPVAD